MVMEILVHIGVAAFVLCLVSLAALGIISVIQQLKG